MEFLSLLYMTIGLLICMIFGLVVYATALIAWVHAKYDHLPGPKRTSFFFGNAMEIKVKARQGREVAVDDNNKLKPLSSEIFCQWADQYGDTFVVFILHRALIYTRSPEVFRAVLVNADQKDFPKSKAINARYLYGARFMGDGLATAYDHDAWYVRRKAMEPIFHRSQLRLSVDVFNATAEHFIEELHTYSESGESFKLNPILHLTTLDVIIKSMFSIDSGHLGTDFHEQARKFVEDTFDGIQKSNIPFTKINPMFRQHRQHIQNTLQTFREVGAKLINDRKSAILDGDAVPSDFLTTLVNASMDPATGYTFETMVDEFVTIIVAGMETSANTLGFVFMELGRRPDLVKRLVHEVDEVVGKKSFISNDDITKLSFIHTLIKESLRLYPPATGVLRVVKKNTILDGLRIPANTDLLVHIFGANRNERYLEDALKFDPDRFDPSQEQKVPVHSFTSFSLGPRRCIAQVFAQMEMKVMLAKFFQHYEFVLDKSEEFILGQSATIFPISGLPCTVRTRE